MTVSKELSIKIEQTVQTVSTELISFLQKLVQTPSLSDHEQAVQGLIAQKFGSLGLEVVILPSKFDEFREHPAFGDDGFSADTRINVLGRWKGMQSGEGKSLILNGHVDVVPPGDPALWSESPWSGLVRDGRLYGRGACDMKAGLCAGIFAVEVLQRMGFRPAQDVLIESVIGEETGGIGTLTTIVNGFRADAAILLEPTRLEISPVQAGALTFRLTVSGKAAHAAMKSEGISAIEKFFPLLQAINQLERERHKSFQHPLFDDPQNVAPISIGTVHGGDWHSTVPDELVAEGRMGVLPGESTEAARAALQAVIQAVAEQDIWLEAHPPRLEWIEGQFESAETAQEDPLIGCLAAAHQLVTGDNPIMRGVTYGSDMRLFINHAQIPATHYGPGDVGLAHVVNECVPLDEVMTVTRVIAALIIDWCGGSIDG